MRLLNFISEIFTGRKVLDRRGIHFDDVVNSIKESKKTELQQNEHLIIPIYVTVSGLVENIFYDEYDHYNSSFTEIVAMVNSGVNCVFSCRYRRKLLKVNKGDYVEIQGRFNKTSSRGYYLTDCRLMTID